MNRDIQALLNDPENQWFERKSFSIQQKDLAKAIVAFANAEGGIIAVGIQDKQLQGKPSSRQDNKIRQTPIDFTDPTVRCTIETIEVPAKSTEGQLEESMVYLFHVDPSEMVHATMAGEVYLRVGDQSQRLGPDDILELRYSKGQQLYDAHPVAGTTTEHLESDDVAAFAQIIGSSTPEQALSARGLVNHKGIPTVAAHLLFGANVSHHFPNAHIRVIRFLESERLPGRRQQISFDKRFEGTISQQLLAARQAILDLLPKVRRLGSEGKFVEETLIPPEVWLEGLVNAVIHRSYSLSGDHIRCEIYPDRIVISSPGRFPGLADPSKPESIARFARNPHIARVAAELSLGQELGEGIRRIFSEMRAVGFLDPVYQQTSGSVVLTLSAVKRVTDSQLAKLPTHAEDVLSALQHAHMPLSTGQVAEALRMSVPSARKALQGLHDEGLIEWNGNSVRDPRATWSVPSAL